MNNQHNSMPNVLRARRVGIDTYRAHVVYMHSDCDVCRSEGFESQARVLVSTKAKSIPATINVVSSELLRPGEVGLSEIASNTLSASEGKDLQVAHLPPPHIISYVRANAYGQELGLDEFRTLVTDVVAGRVSSIQIAEFLTACAGDRMNRNEVASPTSVMLDATVLIDDIASTGCMMIETIHHLRDAGLTSPVYVAVHAIFAGEAFAKLSDAGTNRIVSCNTLPHPSNLLDLSPQMSNAAGELGWSSSPCCSPARSTGQPNVAYRDNGGKRHG